MSVPKRLRKPPRRMRRGKTSSKEQTKPLVKRRREPVYSKKSRKVLSMKSWSVLVSTASRTWVRIPMMVSVPQHIVNTNINGFKGVSDNTSDKDRAIEGGAVQTSEAHTRTGQVSYHPF